MIIRRMVRLMEKILLINDNELTNKNYISFLKNKGYKVVTSLNGRDGIKKAGEEDPDLIILDVKMPGLNGYETASEIRKQKNSSHTPIIFISSVVNDPESRIRGFESGGNDFLTEPVNFDLMHSKIKSFIKEKQYTDEIEKISAKLKTSEEKHRLVLETMTEGYFELDLKGRVTFCNDSICRISGYSRDELLGMNSRDLTTEDMSETISNILKEMHDEGKSPGIINYLMKRKDGGDVFLELSLGLIFEDRVITGFHGIVRDVTERREKEHELMIMGKALENSLNAIAVSDIDGNIEYVNNAFYLMWGLEYRDKIPGINIRDFLKTCPENSEIMQGLRDMGCWLGELNVRNSRGIDFNVFLSSSLIRDDKGETIGIVSTFVDITMRKKAEQKLKESQSRLTERNEAIERDLKLAQYAQNELIKVRVPKSNLLTIGYRYKPLDKIGGDYFSFSVQREGTIGIFLGDVSGHGVASALFISLLKSVSDRVLRRFSTRPSRYITMLNRELLGNMSSYYITGIYGIFGKKSNGDVTFTFTNGGHPSPLVVDSRGEVKLLRGKSMVIGVKKTEKFEEQEIVLKKGDRVFLYTDGIPETMNEKSDMLGFDERLINMFAEGSKLNLEGNLDFIFKCVDDFRGNAEVHDDMLLIGFEVL